MRLFNDNTYHPGTIQTHEITLNFTSNDSFFIITPFHYVKVVAVHQMDT